MVNVGCDESGVNESDHIGHNIGSVGRLCPVSRTSDPQGVIVECRVHNIH
jgi:hypothetical protein